MPANPEKLKLVKTLPRREIVLCLARVPKSSRLVFGGSNGGVYDLDLASAKPEPGELGKHTSYVTGVALAGATAISGSYDGNLIWWDLIKRKQVRTQAAHAKWIRAVAASPDGKTVASVADDMVCRLWDVPTGKLLHELRGHQEITPHHFPSMLYACAFTPDGKTLATGDKIGHVALWDVSTGKLRTTLEAPGFYTWDPVQRRHSIGGIRACSSSRASRVGSGKR